MSLQNELISRQQRRKMILLVSRGDSLKSMGTNVSELTDDLSEKKNTTKRTVRFSKDGNTLRYTLSVYHYYADEIEACWYREEDYTEIRNGCRKQIKKLDQGETLKDKKYCSRGLESYTRWAAKAKALNRKLSIDSVLDEQDRQRRSSNVFNDEAISQRYIRTASSCQLWANTVGLRDQRAAEE
jgi:hypothetical protein